MANTPYDRLPMPGARPQIAQASPRMGFMDRIRNNSDLLLSVGAGLASGRTGPEQFALAMQGASGAANRRNEARRRNDTIEFLRTVDPQLAAAAEAGVVSPGDAYREHLAKARAPQDVRRSLNPIFGTDAQGRQVLLQPNDQGTVEQMAMPEGVTLSTGVDRVDAGTHFVLIDKRTGQAVGTIPKENYQEAFDSAAGSAAGKGVGDASTVLTDMQANMPGLMQTVGQLRELSEQATYTYSGQARDFARRQLGMDPGDSAVAREQYNAIVNNQILPLLRQTFGAQFTVEEGRSLRDTLGADGKSPREKQAVLDAFIAQKVADVQAQAVRAGQASPAPLPQTPSGNARRRYNPQTGELE